MLQYAIDIFLKILSVPIFLFGLWFFVVTFFANSVKLHGKQVYGAQRFKLKAQFLMVGAAVMTISFVFWNFFKL